MNYAGRVERLERGAGIAELRKRAAKRQRLLELLALGALRGRGEAFANFAEVERRRGRLSEAALLQIVGTDAEGFDAAVSDFAAARLRGEYDELFKPRREVGAGERGA